MNPHADHELRILSGVHAGAHEPLGDAGVVLGSAADCDFILEDADMAPRQGRLEASESGWRLFASNPGSGEKAESVAMAPGSLHRVGPIVVSVDAADAPWPDAALVRELLDVLRTSDAEQADAASRPPTGSIGAGTAGSPTDGAAEGAEGSEAGEPREAEEGAGATETAGALYAGERSSGVAPSGPSPHRTRLFIGAALGVIALGLLWAVLPQGEGPSGQALAGVAPAAPPAASGEALVADITRAVDALDLGQAFEVHIDGSGRPRVKMGVLNAADHERLALALAAFKPRPGLSVIAESELFQAVSEAVATQARQRGAVLKVVNAGGGRFRIEGQLETTRQRDELLGELQDALPAVMLESGLIVPEDLAARMLDDLQTARVASVEGRWSEGQLRLDVCTSRSNVARWEALLVSVAQRYPVPFTATLCDNGRVSPAAAAKALAQLPFRVRAVVSGDTPYVVVDDGARLMVGGQRGDWRLASVDAQSVVFESDTRRAVVPR